MAQNKPSNKVMAARLRAEAVRYVVHAKSYAENGRDREAKNFLRDAKAFTQVADKLDKRLDY